MAKLEFMKELESLLSDIPLEERNEALQYYNGYFEDAGEDHEDEIMKELGSPKRVAAIIKADLNSNATDRESRGYFTENGYQDMIYREDKLEIVSTPKESNDKQSNDTKSEGTTGAGSQYTANGNQNKNSNTGLILLIAILSFPIWLPMVLSVFGVAIGIVAAILGIIFGFGIAGITMMVVGVAMFVAGMIQISLPLIGILLIGCGLLVLGLGMLFTIASVALCKNVLPAMIKGIVNLCRLPFKNRSVIA